jgi:hypothetical protein
MKAICPISGVPFRTYDSLPLQWPVDHPIFSIPFDRLVLLLEDIRIQEEELLASWDSKSIALKKEASEAASIKDLTNAASLAMHEKQWTNPAFKLYQTKHLVLLAFMRHSDLIEVEKGYAARPKPSIIDSHFWSGVELFSWAGTLTNPQFQERLPRYRVSQDNEGMENLPEYIEIFAKVRDAIGSKFRSASTERKLAAWEQAITILTRRREINREKLSTSHNPLAAKWALTITNAPKELWDFWYAILSSPSTKITFEGVKVGDKVENVTQGDLRELYDFLDDNLSRPKGEVGEYHRDDSEFYYIARQTVLSIIRTHILILEQGTSSYKIVNAAIGDQIVSLSDDLLETRAKQAGLQGKPSFANYPKKIDFIRALAAWRTEVKTELLAKAQEGLPELNKEEKGKYEIL